MTNLTPAEVRTIEFTERRKGLDKDEVEAFMEDVCATLVAADERYAGVSGAIDEQRARAEAAEARLAELEAQLAQAQADLGSMQGEGAAERDANRVALEEATAALAEAQQAMQEMADELNAMRATAGVTESVDLLFSAQQAAADTINRANALATETRREADDYAAVVRAEADDYAAATREETNRWAEDIRVQAEQDLVNLREQAAQLRDRESEYRAQVSSVLRSALEFVDVPVLPAPGGEAPESELFEESDVVDEYSTPEFEVESVNDDQEHQAW